MALREATIEDELPPLPYREENGLILPHGCRFAPTDYELVVGYLLTRILGLPLPWDIIHEIDSYNYDPDQFPKKEFIFGNEKESYFFTRTHHQKYTHPTPSGYWKATSRDAEVSCGKKVVGFKKTWTFYMGKAPRGTRTAWTMVEFRVNPNLLPASVRQGPVGTDIGRCVVCRVRHKDNKGENQEVTNLQPAGPASAEVEVQEEEEGEANGAWNLEAAGDPTSTTNTSAGSGE